LASWRPLWYPNGSCWKTTTPMYTRTPSGRLTTRRCSVYLGKPVRSLRVRSNRYRWGYTRERLETSASYAELRLLFFLTCLIHWLNRTIGLTCCDGRWETSDIPIVEYLTFRLLRVELSFTIGWTICSWMLLKLTVLNTSTKSTNFWSNIYLFKIQNIYYFIYFQR